VGRHRKTRFFVGIHEIGDFTLRLSQGLRHWGVEVTNVVRQLQSPILTREQSHDAYIPRSRSDLLFQSRLIGEFLKQSWRHDVFVFNFCTSFTGYLQDNASRWIRMLAFIDLPVLKTSGKRIVVIANGDDIRSRRLLLREMELAGLHGHVKHAVSDLDLGSRGLEEINRERAKKIEKYADHIFTRPMSAQFLKRDYDLLWLPTDLSTLEFCVGGSQPPVVVHAPSESKVKGTGYVEGAVKTLKQEGYSFRFELCQNMTNPEIRRILASADIAIDQLILPGYGLFAVEAMATGCAVLSSAVAGYNGFPVDLPIMTTTPDTIYENLKKLLEDRDLRARMAHEGRAYVEQYHDHIKVARGFLDRVGEG
jgi:glycosyltransferase involved in cell wall biosynthesis